MRNYLWATKQSTAKLVNLGGLSVYELVEVPFGVYENPHIDFFVVLNNKLVNFFKVLQLK